MSGEHDPANRRLALETRREAAGSAEARQGDATTYQGLLVVLNEGQLC